MASHYYCCWSNLQWCLLTVRLKTTQQSWHMVTWPSGIQTGQVSPSFSHVFSTRSLSARLSFVLLKLAFLLLSSSTALFRASNHSFFSQIFLKEHYWKKQYLFFIYHIGAEKNMEFLGLLMCEPKPGINPFLIVGT